MNYFIRNFEPYEATILSNMEKQCLPLPSTGKMILEGYSHGDIIYVAIVEKIIVGFLSFSIIFDEISINSLCVLTPYRGHGIASALLLKMLKYAKKNDIKKIFLEVAVDNNPAFQLYQKNGFFIIATRKRYYGDIDAYVMQKNIM